jgi:AmmeMemoRadiSam system protein B
MNARIPGTKQTVGATTRAPAVAGRFYPAEPKQLRADVERMLDSVVAPSRTPSPKALIAPHAGYFYSGPVAASAFAQWRADRGSIRRVVVIGPAHYARVDGLASCSAGAFETPLGSVPVDTDCASDLVSKGLVSVSDAAHEPEHCIEVELPFLQVVLDEFSIVPLLAGSVPPAQVALVIDQFLDDKGTRILISSDLSHYLDWESARAMDMKTAGAIEALEAEAIQPAQACGREPVCGLLLAARKAGMRAATLDLRNSGDTSGRKDKVVGYGAFAIG